MHLDGQSLPPGPRVAGVDRPGLEDHVPHFDVLEWKLMSCSHVKSLVNLVLIGCSLLCSQSGVSMLVDTTLDKDYNS